MGRSRTRNDENQKCPLSGHFSDFPSLFRDSAQPLLGTHPCQGFDLAEDHHEEGKVLV